MDHQNHNRKQNQPKRKNKFLNLLPKSASIVVFHQNPPYSPSREKRQEMNKQQLKSHIRRGFSGPIISIIPEEVRRKSKSGNFDNQEPTSPKVSCMGQIKLKKKLKKCKSSRPSFTSNDHHHQSKPVKPTGSAIRRMFSRTTSKPVDNKYPDSYSEDINKPCMVLSDREPSLGKMKKFSSGRDHHHLSNFDWTAQIAPVDHDDHKNYYSSYHDDEERDESDGEREDTKISFSAPLGIGGLRLHNMQPKKEINLWKRRTMAPPRPLQLDSV